MSLRDGTKPQGEKKILEELNKSLDEIEKISSDIQREVLEGEYVDFDKGFFDACMETIKEIIYRCKIELNGGEE